MNVQTVSDLYLWKLQMSNEPEVLSFMDFEANKKHFKEAWGQKFYVKTYQ